jgi:hypothetical protein
MQYVVMNGSPFDGMIVNGPFASAEDASEWAEALTTDWWVGELEPVEDAPLNSFYAGWDPEKVENMHMDLGKAYDDLGDANAKIRSLEKALQAAQDHDDHVHERLNRAMDALDAIANRVHAAIGGCNLPE